jgi:hypothetical protein
MLKSLSIFTVYVLATISLSAQEFVLNWQKTYGGERNEVVYGGVETTDGGFILVGSTNSKNRYFGLV